MENLLLSINVVMPLVCYMAIGALLRKTGLVSRQSFNQLSQLVFYVAIPALCIDNLRTQDLETVFSDPFALYLGAGILLIFAICMVVVPLVSRENRRRGVLIQGIFRSNDGVFGIAVGAALLGETNMGLMILAVAVTIPIYNILAVAEMELFRGEKPDFLKVLMQIIKNPIVIGCALGLTLGIFHIPVPRLLERPLAGLSSVCSPLGFIALGGALTFDTLRENRKAITVVSLLRLLVIPVLCLTVMYLMGYRGDHLLVTVVIFGAPTAMTLYPMACSMNGDEKLAGGLVAVTSVLSMVTMFFFIYLLKQTGVA
jgi:predicted permease